MQSTQKIVLSISPYGLTAGNVRDGVPDLHNLLYDWCRPILRNQLVQDRAGIRDSQVPEDGF